MCLSREHLSIANIYEGLTQCTRFTIDISASQHPDTGYLVKMEGKQGHTPLTLWIQKVSGKIVLASLCTLEHFLDHFTLNKILFHDVSAILNSHLHWTPSLPPILNELRIANFPELLMSFLRTKTKPVIRC